MKDEQKDLLRVNARYWRDEEQRDDIADAIEAALADSERCERLEGAIKKALDLMNYPYQHSVARRVLIAALEVPDGE